MSRAGAADDLLRRIAADLERTIAASAATAASARALAEAREVSGLDASAARAKAAQAEEVVARMCARRERLLAHVGLGEGALVPVLMG